MRWLYDPACVGTHWLMVLPSRPQHHTPQGLGHDLPAGRLGARAASRVSTTPAGPLVDVSHMGLFGTVSRDVGLLGGRLGGCLQELQGQHAGLGMACNCSLIVTGRPLIASSSWCDDRAKMQGMADAAGATANSLIAIGQRHVPEVGWLAPGPGCSVSAL